MLDYFKQLVNLKSLLLSKNHLLLLSIPVAYPLNSSQCIHLSFYIFIGVHVLHTR